MRKLALASAAVTVLAAGPVFAQGMPQALINANQPHPSHAFFEADRGSSTWISQSVGARHGATASPERTAANAPVPQRLAR